MKSRFICAGLMTAVLGATGATAALRDSTSSTDGGDAQRLVTILDYISTDYAGAVKDGAVLSELEYTEQQAFIATARELAATVTGNRADPLAANIAAIAPLIDAKADPSRIEAVCRSARDQVVKRFDLTTIPAERPSLPAAEKLFAESCAQCHGVSGDGQTPLAATLDPAPADFKDPERLAVLAPYRVFNTLTFGVPGTGMPSYEAFSPAERWSLAFYVFRLAHAGETAAAARAVPTADLARATDAALRERLKRELPAPLVGTTLAFLRSEAPFLEPPQAEGIRVARRFLDAGTTAYREGRIADAERALVDAYLQGFEPLEPRLMARDPALVPEVERAFSNLRRALTERATPDAFANAANDLDLRLSRADSERAVITPFVSSFLVVFREAIEAALLVGALLAGARRLGRPDAKRFIHLGWVAALPAGVLTWFAFEKLLHLGADRRELLEAFVALLAAAVLFCVSFWMISKAESRHWMAYLRRNLESTLGRRSLWLVCGVAFLAVYREAAETVLFLQAIVLESEGATHEVWMGLAAAAVAAFACAFVMNRAIARLPLGPFFAVSGILLCLLAVSFAGSGIYTLVSSGYLMARPVNVPAIPWLGVHPDLASLLVQLAIVSTIALAALLTWRRPSAD